MQRIRRITVNEDLKEKITALSKLVDELKAQIDSYKTVVFGQNGSTISMPREKFEHDLYKAMKKIPSEEDMKKNMEIILEEKARELKSKPKRLLNDLTNILRDLAVLGMFVIIVLNLLGIKIDL